MVELSNILGVTDHRHYVDNIESKIENRWLQESFLKNRSFWKLFISLETYMKQGQ